MLNALQINKTSNVIDLSIEQSMKLCNFEDAGKVPAVSESEFYQSIAVQLY